MCVTGLSRTLNSQSSSDPLSRLMGPTQLFVSYKIASNQILYFVHIHLIDNGERKKRKERKREKKEKIIFGACNIGFKRFWGA